MTGKILYPELQTSIESRNSARTLLHGDLDTTENVLIRKCFRTSQPRSIVRVTKKIDWGISLRIFNYLRKRERSIHANYFYLEAKLGKLV